MKTDIFKIQPCRKVILGLLITIMGISCEKNEIPTLSNLNKIEKISLTGSTKSTFNLDHKNGQANLNLRYTEALKKQLEAPISISFLVSKGASLKVGDIEIKTGEKITFKKKTSDAKKDIFTKDITVIAANKETKKYRLIITLNKTSTGIVTPILSFDFSGRFYYVITGHSTSLPALKGAYTGSGAGTISYHSSNTDKIEVNEKGQIKAKKIGSVTITASQAAGPHNKAAKTTIKVFCYPTSTIRNFSVTTVTQNNITLSWSRFNFKGTYYKGSYLIKITDLNDNPITGSPFTIEQPKDSSVRTIVKNITGLKKNTAYKITGYLKYGTILSKKHALASKTVNTLGDSDMFLYDSTTGIISGYTPKYASDKTPKVLTIPSQIGSTTITGIGVRAFYKNTTITEVIMPNTLTKIDDLAFNKCTNISQITFSSQLQEIGMNGFLETGITTLNNLPNTLVKIGESAFQNCTKLQRVTIPESVTHLGDKLFAGCNNLSQVNLLSKKITEIPDFCFTDTSLTSFNITSNIKEIGGFAFLRCKKLKKVTIENGVTEISSYAFRETAIEHLKIPSSVTKIGTETFQYCKALKSITFSEGLKYIGIAAFKECHQLTYVKLPTSIETIQWEAFSQNTIATPAMVVKMPNKAIPPKIIYHGSSDPDVKSNFYKVKEIQIPKAYEAAYRNELVKHQKWNDPTKITTY